MEEEAVYEISTNYYGTAGEPSDFWIPERRAMLDPTTRAKYYPPLPLLVGTLPLQESTDTEQRNESLASKADEEEIDAQLNQSPPSTTVSRTVQTNLSTYMFYLSSSSNNG